MILICSRRTTHHVCLLLLLLCLVLAVTVMMCVRQVETKEVFSSVAKMKTLPALERELLRKFEDVLKPLSPENAAVVELKRRIENLKRVNSRYVHNTSMMENPFHAFRLIKRMVKQWAAVFRATKGLIPQFFNSTHNWLHQLDTSWPSDADLSGAATALVRLHHIYNLDYDALQRGRFLNVTSPPMTSLELSYVTRAAVELGYVCDVKELWSGLETARQRRRREEEEGEEKGAEEEKVGRERTGSRETTALMKHLRRRIDDLMIGTVSECDHNSSFNIPSIDTLAKASVQARKDAVRAMYHHICRTLHEGQCSPVVYGSGRKCYWQPSHIPYLRFKADVVNSDPFIVVFHDVINDDETRELKDLSFGKICPSELAVDQVEHEKHLVRVSQNAWLFDSNPVIARLSRRVHLVTGLSTRILKQDTHAEPYQVLNYGLGGVYGPHEDSVRVPRQQGKEHNAPHLRHAGDRTATWMYYLSDVPLGGATVFPLLGAAIRPLKGTAVLWYNLKRSGHADVRTVHAGCPVLYGDKWVANKWVREVGNVFSRPCLLDPDL